jgi:hypothetical protein
LPLADEGYGLQPVRYDPRRTRTRIHFSPCIRARLQPRRNPAHPFFEKKVRGEAALKPPRTPPVILSEWPQADEPKDLRLLFRLVSGSGD